MSGHALLPELRDHAAGAEPSPRLATHLRTCTACAAALDAESRLLEEIDGILASVREVEPSPLLLARARALGARRDATRSWLPGLRTAAALLVVGLSTALLLRFEPKDVPAPTLSAPGSPASPPAAPPPQIARSVEPAPRSVPPPRPARVAAAIVPPGQEAVIRRFVALVESGVVDLPPQVLETDPSGLPLQEPAELFVPPLTIAPIEADEAPSEE